MKPSGCRHCWRTETLEVESKFSNLTLLTYKSHRLSVLRVNKKLTVDGCHKSFIIYSNAMVSGLSLKHPFGPRLKSFEAFLMPEFCGFYEWKHKQVVPNPRLQSHLLFTPMKQIQTIVLHASNWKREKSVMVSHLNRQNLHLLHFKFV